MLHKNWNPKILRLETLKETPLEKPLLGNPPLDPLENRASTYPTYPELVVASSAETTGFQALGNKNI